LVVDFLLTVGEYWQNRPTEKVRQTSRAAGADSGTGVRTLVVEKLIED
jgi:hypothetical protein